MVSGFFGSLVCMYSDCVEVAEPQCVWSVEPAATSPGCAACAVVLECITHTSGLSDSLSF